VGERKNSREEVQAQVDKVRQETVLMAEMATQESLAPLRSELDALREAFESLQGQYQSDMESFADMQAAQRAASRRGPK
jgi:predicted  nucleic acid-binding Zn-ribbon protein